jgi:hypothetical protein
MDRQDWRLNHVGSVTRVHDKSGIQCLIYWLDNVVGDACIRLDVMREGFPIISFQGHADDVRKAAMRWVTKAGSGISLEHAAYVGAELERCDAERIDYMQA